LPPGWIIISSINPPSEKYIVNELDSATIARFCQIRFNPEVEEWNQYAAKRQLYDPVRVFIQEYPQFLGIEMCQLSYEPVDCPRTVEMMANTIEGLDEDLIYEVAAGCIGNDAAASFMSHINSKERPIPADKILNEYGTVSNRVAEYAQPKKNRADLLKVSIDDLVVLLSKIEKDLTDKQVKNLHEFIKDIPKDLGVGFLKLMIHSESSQVQDHFRTLASDQDFRNFLQTKYKHIGMEQLDD
jgi:hypothetical protein